MRRKIPRVGLLCLVCLGGLSNGLSWAGETITYNYDPLGRLTSSSASGGPNSGVGTVTCFDAAGNRSQYQTGTSVTACSVPAPPTNAPLPTPPAAPASPPVAGVVTGSGACNTNKAVTVASGGNTLVSVWDLSGSNVDVVSFTSTTVTLNGYYPETDTLLYTIVNSQGITAVGTINYTTTGQPSVCTA